MLIHQHYLLNSDTRSLKNMFPLKAITFLAATAVLVSAHADFAPIHYRRDATAARDAIEKRCGEALMYRRVKRNFNAFNHVQRSNIIPRSSISNDSTCILTPEITQGPYHILREAVRQNITESQLGIPMTVEIDFFDIETCNPVQHANATGYYSGYVAETGATLASGGGFGGDTGSSNSSTNSTGPGDDTAPSGFLSGGPGSPTDAPDASQTATATAEGSTSTSSYGPYSGADSTSASSMLDTTTTDNSTFLRGAWLSDEDGHLTVYSIVPGWYTGRAVHYHIKAYSNGSIAENGTFVPIGSAVHTGQLFFPEDVMDEVANNTIYAANVISWDDATKNDEDQWYPYEDSSGYDADVDVTYVGETIEEGIIASIAVGLNLTYSSPELSTQYAAVVGPVSP